MLIKRVKGYLVAWLVVVVALCGGYAAHGQTVTPSPINGSYTNPSNCVSTSYNLTTKQITATCFDNGHNGHVSTLDYSGCDTGADVWNEFGVLYCYAVPGSYGFGTVIPHGSYHLSCENEHSTLQGYGPSGKIIQLTASCSNGNGQHVNAKLGIDNTTGHCLLNQDIWNDHGVLRCYFMTYATKKRSIH